MLTIVVAVALVVVAAVSSVALVHLVDSRHAILDQTDPASLSADQLLVAYVDEETGVRGYILGRNTSYLHPALSGLREQLSAAHNLNEELQNQPNLLRLAQAAEKAGQCGCRHGSCRPSKRP